MTITIYDNFFCVPLFPGIFLLSGARFQIILSHRTHRAPQASFFLAFRGKIQILPRDFSFCIHSGAIFARTSFFVPQII